MTKTADIIDGLGKTYLLGEKHVQPDKYAANDEPGDNESAYVGYDLDTIRWTKSSSPVPYAPVRDTPGIPQYCGHFGSAHADVCHFTFCDGAVRAIAYSIDPETHRRLGNRRDRLPVTLPVP